MPKKNRKKIKRLLRTKFEQQAAQFESIAIQESGTDEQKAETAQPKIIKQTDLEIEDAAQTKREIAKILITILILILIVVAIYFVNIKTDLILSVGEFVAEKFNLSI